MANSERIRWQFVAAWTLLVVVVTVGFWIQARIIEEAKTTQAELAVVTAKQQQLIMALQDQLVPANGLCDLFLTLAEELKEPTGLDLTREFKQEFAQEGIRCRPLVNP